MEESALFLFFIKEPILAFWNNTQPITLFIYEEDSSLGRRAEQMTQGG